MRANTKVILNLGCGADIMEDAINIDRVEREGVDKVWDLKGGIPFDDHTMEKVYANYFLCQILEPEKFMHVMNEIWRVLKPNGYLYIKVPDAKYPAAFQDPMDCRRFTKETFDYLNKTHYRYKSFNYGFKPWTVVSVKPEKKDRLFATLRKAIRV